MHLAEVVGDNEQGHGMTMVCEFARPSGTKAGEASVKRPDAQIEAFNVRRANLVHLGRTRNGFQSDASAFWLAVTVIRVNQLKRIVVLAINLLHHGKVETASRISFSSLCAGGFMLEN
jgi:hypothetical protein